MKPFKLFKYIQYFPFLLVLGFFVASGMMLKGQLTFFLLISMIGIYFIFKGKNRLYKEQKYFVYILIAIFITVSSSCVLNGDYELFFKYPFEVFKYLIFVPLVAVAINGLNLTEQNFYKTFIIASSYSLYLAIYIIYYNVPRSIGVLESPIILGNLGVLFAVISLVVAFRVSGTFWKIFAVLFFLSGIILSFLSGSRGGWLAILFALITMFSLAKFDGPFKKWHIVIFVFMIMSLTLYFLWDILPIQNRVMLAVSNFQEYQKGYYQTSVGYRFEMWKAGWYGYLDKPVLGWGFTHYSEVFKKYLELGLVKSRGDFVWGHPHNDFVQILVEFGLVGFVIFMAAFIYPLVFFFKHAMVFSKNNKQMLFLSLIGIIMIEAILEFMLTNRGVTIIYIFHFYIVLTLILMKLIRQVTSQQQAKDQIVKFVEFNK